jgi:para-aminobenzoate synthetase / 4-amino-4-deoxychorismate lyase
MSKLDDTLNEVLIHHPGQDCWLHFRNAVDVLETFKINEVVSVIEDVEQALKRGLYAAGFIAYEASSAFDRALKTKPPGDFPLIWFGLYKNIESLSTIPPSCDEEKSHETKLNWNASASRDEYDQAIGRIKTYIARGDTYQVNYTYRLRSSFSGGAYKLFVDLARAQKAPYAAFVDTGRFVLCSASPELFFTLEQDKIVSRPMKGTASRGFTLQGDNAQADWLKNSEKNRAENVMIVDMVRNDIGRIAETGSVHVPDLFVMEKYPTVWQMVSTVSGKADANLREILRALFPPASITGAPKARTMEIIKELETSPRKVYTGGIGFAGPDRRMQFNVAIRTAIIDRDEGSVEYGVGGGITWDSIDSAEYEECKAKARILTVRLPEFSLLETMRWTPEQGYVLLDLHLSRMQDSAAYFDFPIDIQYVRDLLQESAESFDDNDQKIRLLVNEVGTVSIEAVAVPESEADIFLRVCLSKEPIDTKDVFLYHKTTNRAVYDRARELNPGFDDVILWNERGEVTESSIANLVVELDGVLFTPPVSCGLLPGTYRSWLLSQGLVTEREIKVDELNKCSQFYLVNSVRGKIKIELVNTL